MGARLSKKRTMIRTLPEDINFELSSLYRACRDNDIKRVKHLLMHMTFEQINRTELNGQTALFIATMNNNVRIVKLLKKYNMLFRPLLTEPMTRTFDDISLLSLDGLMIVDNRSVIERCITYEENLRNDFNKIGINTMLLTIQQHYIPLLWSQLSLSTEECSRLECFITETCEDCTPIPLVSAITLTPAIFQHINRDILQLMTYEFENKSLNLISVPLQYLQRCLLGTFMIWPLLLSFHIRSRVQHRVIIKSNTLMQYETGMIIMVKKYLQTSTKWPLPEDQQLLKEVTDDPSNILVTCRYWVMHGKNAKVVSLNELTVRRNTGDTLLLPLSRFVITKITRSSSFEVTMNFVELPSNEELNFAFEPPDNLQEVRSSLEINSSLNSLKNNFYEHDVVSRETDNSYDENPVLFNSNIILYNIFERCYPPDRSTIDFQSTKDHYHSKKYSTLEPTTTTVVQSITQFSLVLKELLLQPFGTFLVRKPIDPDDKILSLPCILLNSSSTDVKCSTSMDNLILSVRVDESVYTCSIMHYSLQVKDESDIHSILTCYNRNQSTNNEWTPLRTQYLVTDKLDNTLWDLDHNRIETFQPDNSLKHIENNCIGYAKSTYCSKPNKLDIFIKIFSKDDDYFRMEFDILKSLGHFSIISLYGTYSTTKYIYLILSDNGKSLSSFCPVRCDANEYKTYQIANIGFQLATGMLYLERKNIVHRDLCADNVLVDHHGIVRIADFGLAIQKNEIVNRRKCTQQRFRFKFLAPECFSPHRFNDKGSVLTYSESMRIGFSSKSDVWSYGLLLIQLFLKKPSVPYPDIDEREIIKYITIDRRVHEQPRNCRNDVYELLRSCWTYDANERPTFDILRDKMLKMARVNYI